MRRLLGPHIGGQWANKLEILHKWQPPLILVLQPEVDKVKQLRDAIPGAIIIGRFFHDDSHYSDNINARPKEFAREIHNEIVGNPVTTLLDYAQSNNETNQDWVGIQKLNEFTQEWMALADQSQAYKCAILAFSVGNPDMPHKPGDLAGFDGRMLYWQQVLPSLNYAQANSHILLLHAYGYPDMFAPNADWYIYRYERQVQANLRTLGITKLKYAYGEIGIDRLIVNGKGGYKVVPTTDEGYVNQTLQWEKDLQGQDLLLGGAIFTLGDSGGWDTYDIGSTNVASMIATHYADHAGDYDASGAVDDGGHAVFVPMAGTGQPAQATPPERQIDPRLLARGVTINETTSSDPNQLLWRIVEAKFFNQAESQGRHHIYVEALDSSGNPVNGVPLLVRSQGSPQKELKTNGRTGFDATNEPMWASEGKNGYSIKFWEGDTIAGLGMGEDTPEGFNAGIHTSILVKAQQRKAAQQPPQPPTKPTPAYVIAPAGARVRAQPSTESDTLAIAPYAEQIRIIGVESVPGWVRVRYGEIEGYMASRWIGLVAPEPLPAPSEPTPEPEPVPAASGIIDPLTALAFLQVESNNKPFANGLLTIRFEVHRFKVNLKNDELFNKHFRFKPGDYSNQEVRTDIGNGWFNAHGSMAHRHDVLRFARSLDDTAALRSTGMGMAQVMGEGHKRIGYTTVQDMFNAFSHQKFGAAAQIMGFVNYCLSDPGLLAAIKASDFLEMTRRYNGIGQEAIYVPALQKALAQIRAEIGVA